MATCAPLDYVIQDIVWPWALQAEEATTNYLCFKMYGLGMLEKQWTVIQSLMVN